MTTLRILLATTSDVKKNAITKYCETVLTHYQIVVTSINCDDLGLPPQPINCGAACAKQRVEYAKKNTPKWNELHDIVIAIESDLTKINNEYFDIAHIRIESNNLVGTGISTSIKCPVDVNIFDAQSEIFFSANIKGYPKTGGQFLHESMGCDPKNWMAKFSMDRKDQIISGLDSAFKNFHTNVNYCYLINSAYKIYPNFPKEGVDFKYFYSLFGKNGMKNLRHILKSKFRLCEIDAVLPLETRGLILGTLLSEITGCSMIPVQKPAKIPGEVVTRIYEKEYGTDTLKISMDLFTSLLDKHLKHYNFMIVDDVIATGGTIHAVLEILEFLAEQHSFTCDIMIVSLSEVTALREEAMQKIKIDYCVLFKDIEQIHELFINFPF
jgi:adenine phosphoribosyltransferase